VCVCNGVCVLPSAAGVCPGGASLVRARVGRVAELGSPGATPPGATPPGAPDLFPLHVVEWVRLGYNVPILIKFGVYAPRVHPNYKGRVSLSGGASLRVEGLTLEDEGWFECRILLLDSKTDEFRNGTWTFLSITAPPVFIKTPPAYVEVLLGDSLTLSCGAHGNPRPTVVWHKDETPIVRHEKIKVGVVLNGSLSLITATRDTTGVYKCHVSNTEGNLTHYTQLQVKGPPIILISPGDTTLNMSQDAVLQCQADAFPSNLTYEWLKHGQNVYHIESLKTRVKILVDGTLLIPNLMPEDAGNYTCIPTNGILTPPSASAHLKVKHPARVGRMSRQTFLPSGMGGVIVCPVQADPPLLYVNWTKDGNNINVDNFPGWMVNSEGSVFITTANDNAVGMYTCTAYNSYGTMGRSDPTQVILKDPPAFRVTPRAEYLQEVGRDLIIPCEAKGDPVPNITWSKIGPLPRSPYMVLANGSLLLQPLSKDHHGGWECLATNHVATVSAGTLVMALGTSPHAVTTVSVTAKMNQANVSWVAGFDGGFSQKFTVWVKQASRGKHEWASLPVPTSKDNLLVTGLLAATNYQFSVLPQNKLGSGPFSEIVSVRTQVSPTTAVPTEAPLVVLSLPGPDPPTLLLANRTDQGVLLQWAPPEAPASPLTGYVLQGRREQGQWVVLSGDVGAGQTDMLVQGLLRVSLAYDLRLLSRSLKILSVPSESVNVSTAGMEMYPIRASFLEYVPQSLLAGVVGGVCFLFMAIVLALVTACFMSHRRQKRRIKRRQGKDKNHGEMLMSLLLNHYVPPRRPSFENLERVHPSQRPPANSPYLNYPMYPPRSASVHARMEPSDPRRQTTVFPEVSRWPVSYQENMRAAPHKYVPMSIPPPQPPYRHFPRVEPVRAVDPRMGPSRSFLPRGNSWPSPHPAPLPAGQSDGQRETVERPLTRAGDNPDYRESREGGRTSYASQSSGRGSAGFLRQSLSITPTLTHLWCCRRFLPCSHPTCCVVSVTRRNTSVDESYEWDSVDPGVDAEVLEAMSCDRPPASDPSGRDAYGHPLSEARFKALRLEYQEYMQALESTGPRQARPTSDPESDSDSGSALL
uniref:Immunoglobulin superfamily, member 9b n=1 Tax=Gadus morhua TaxID=8049 RepID=A0A8C5CCT7_GADMO